MTSPQYAKQLRAAREKAGKTIDEMAQLLNISVASYYDLESYADEVTTCLSLRQAAQLFRVLGIDPQEFFERSSLETEIVTLDGLFERINNYLTTHQITVSDLEDEVGWEIEPLLKEHSKLLEYDIDALKDICNRIGIDWLGVFLYVISQHSK